MTTPSISTICKALDLLRFYNISIKEFARKTGISKHTLYSLRHKRNGSSNLCNHIALAFEKEFPDEYQQIFSYLEEKSNV